MTKEMQSEIIKKDPLQASLEIRGMDIRQFRVIKEILYPNVQKDETLLMAIDYCKARNLDIMKRTIQIVPIWDSKSKSMKDTIWPSIAEVRITATRTGQYAGRSEAEFGDEITETLSGVEVTYPKWCKITVYRFVKGEKCPFTSKLFWKQEYKVAKNDTTAPNSMWAKRNYAQLEKCVEAAALRMAFPEEVGNDYIGDEAFDVNENFINVTPKSKTASAHSIPPALERSFNVSELKNPVEPIQTDITDHIEEYLDMVAAPELEDKSEELFARIEADLNKVINAKAVENCWNTHKEGLDYLNTNKPEYFAELLSLKAKRLGALK